MRKCYQADVCNSNATQVVLPVTAGLVAHYLSAILAGAELPVQYGGGWASTRLPTIAAAARKQITVSGNMTYQVKCKLALRPHLVSHGSTHICLLSCGCSYCGQRRSALLAVLKGVTTQLSSALTLVPKQAPLSVTATGQGTEAVADSIQWTGQQQCLGECKQFIVLPSSLAAFAWHCQTVYQAKIISEVCYDADDCFSCCFSI